MDGPRIDRSRLGGSPRLVRVGDDSGATHEVVGRPLESPLERLGPQAGPDKEASVDADTGSDDVPAEDASARNRRAVLPSPRSLRTRILLTRVCVVPRWREGRWDL